MSANQQEWERRAAGWIRDSDEFETKVEPLTDVMLGQACLNPGGRALELACGPGGMIPRVLEAVSPGGAVVAADISPKMVEAARDRFGGDAVEVMEMGLDWIDSPARVADSILVRFGYMFADDPAAALHEARRVLKPGGRLVAAIWAEPERNPYGVLPAQALADLGAGSNPEAGDPGMFRLAEPGLFREMCLDAAFVEVEVREVELAFSWPGLQELLDSVSERLQVADALKAGGFELQDRFDARVEELARPWTAPDGTVTLPGVALSVAAEA